jgi:hypothetical protein
MFFFTPNPNDDLMESEWSATNMVVQWGHHGIQHGNKPSKTHWTIGALEPV